MKSRLELQTLLENLLGKTTPSPAGELNEKGNSHDA